MNLVKNLRADSVLSTVRTVTAAFEAGLAGGSAQDGSIRVQLPDEFALIRRSEGLPVLRGQSSELIGQMSGLHSNLAELVHAVAGTEFGDLLSAKRPRTNPELLARTRATAVQVCDLCGEPLRAVRLLAGYDNLPGLFHEATEIESLQSANPKPADAPEEMKTTPEEALRYGMPSVIDSFDDMLRALENALAKRPEPDGLLRVTLPSGLRPRHYAEGMREVWALTERALRSAGELTPKLRNVYVTVIRTEIGEASATRSMTNGEFCSEVRVTGYACTLILEEICRIARLLEQMPALGELLGR